ncbi:MAG: hypothetical protein IKF14_01835 [Atopobiaceae bacterium]|nr:hypothetical protein [Atopobiaceae bacterium]
MRKKLAAALLVLVLALVAPLSTAWAAGDLDEIVDYNISVTANSDATLSMTYHIEWKVLDSTSEGPLTWVRVGIPNEHYNKLEGLSRTVKSIRYDSSGGDYARIDLDKAYYAGDVVKFDFKLVQDYMYRVTGNPAEKATYEFTPGWFDDVKVDNLEVRWNARDVADVSPSARQDDGYYVWNTSLSKGERFTVSVTYPIDALAFDAGKSNASSGRKGSSVVFVAVLSIIGFAVIVAVIRSVMKKGGSTDVKGCMRVLLIVLLLPMMVSLGPVGWVALYFILRKMGTDRYASGSGFVSSAQVKRTKIVYCRHCTECGTPREGSQTVCSNCGHSLIWSETPVSEDEVPSELKDKVQDGEYAYGNVPDTYLVVRTIPAVVPAHVVHTTTRHRSTRHRSSTHRSGSRSRSCACACACACAGGGRAGCSTKDFYNTDLKLRQLM